MTIAQIENRLLALEETVAEIKSSMSQPIDPRSPWWRTTSGRFANDPDFEEIVALGRAYRESLRPKDDEEQ